GGVHVGSPRAHPGSTGVGRPRPAPAPDIDAVPGAGARGPPPQPSGVDRTEWTGLAGPGRPGVASGPARSARPAEVGHRSCRRPRTVTLCGSGLDNSIPSSEEVLSMPAIQRDRLAALIGPAVEAAGYDLEGVTVSQAGRRSLVRVVVDADGGVTLDGVADVSRAVSTVLDDNDGLTGRSPYVLEITS